MEKFNVSRAYIYKMLKENDIECKSEVQTNIDITEINEIDSDDIFNDLNDNQEETVETIIQNTPEPEIEPEPEIQKHLFHQLIYNHQQELVIIYHLIN